MAELITDAEQVTPDWLTCVLCKKGHLAQGKVTKIEKQSVPMPYASIITYLKVSYSGNAPKSAPMRLLLKRSKHEDKWKWADKEVQFYNTIAKMMTNPPVAHCYDAVYSPQIGHYHVLLEDVSESHFVLESEHFPPSKRHCEKIVDCLAAFHAYWWEDARLGNEIVGCFYEENYLINCLRNTEKKFAEFVDFLGDRLSATDRQTYEAIFASWPDPLVKRLDKGNATTLIHRDSHVRNYLLPRDPNSDHVYIIDWADWDICVGVRDLAYMMALHWYPARRQVLEKELLLRYHRDLLAHGVEDYDWDAFWYDYRLSVIQLYYLPVWRWVNEHPTWWHDLQRFILAFQDLGCAELLER